MWGTKEWPTKSGYWSLWEEWFYYWNIIVVEYNLKGRAVMILMFCILCPVRSYFMFNLWICMGGFRYDIRNWYKWRSFENPFGDCQVAASWQCHNHYSCRLLCTFCEYISYAFQIIWPPDFGKRKWYFKHYLTQYRSQGGKLIV